MLLSSKRASLFALSLLSATAMSAYAGDKSEHIVVAPTCLLSNTSFAHTTLAKTGELALIKTDFNGINYLIDTRDHRHGKCGGFMDVTQAWIDSPKASLSAGDHAAQFLKSYTAPATKPSLKGTSSHYKIQYTTTVNQLLATMNPQDMWTDLTKLSSFDDRYADSNNGVNAAAWIKTQVEAIATAAGRKDITAYYVKTGTRYKQPSLVIKFGDSNEPGVVIGGHMDTLPSSRELKPGADDDGSGSVTVMEVARTLIGSGLHFKKPIYFVWYSAEEMGLVGSQYVVSDFKQKNIPVDAVAQFDMTGYRYRNDPTMWLMDDFVNKDLTTFTETLINTYVKAAVKHSRCGYACSDHASWTQGGFKSVMPFESSMNTDNPDIHTSRDTMANLSLDHMTNYAKLATAFAVELAEPVA
jgi:leucyl aminopeptidase